MIGSYKNIRKLQKHPTFGDLYLVQDENRDRFALRLVKKDNIHYQEIRKMIDTEVECTNKCKLTFCPYLTKLIELIQTQEWLQIVYQYCSGGDLLAYQAKQPNKVFSLDQAIQILKDVIIGLQLLHSKGYIHRNIKSGNILIKQWQGKDIYQLSDFKLVIKPQNASQENITGFEQFMAPQIFEAIEDQSFSYSYEIDIWALGMTFYFMLNMQFPFLVNGSLKALEKAQYIKKQAHNFSYQKAVSQSKKKLSINCTPQVQRLFKRFFQTDPSKRITLTQLKQNQLFMKYFPKILQEKFLKILPKNTVNQLLHLQQIRRLQIQEQKLRQQKKQEEFFDQRQYLQLKMQEIKFLQQILTSFQNLCDILVPQQKAMLIYSLRKYIIFRFKVFRYQLNKRDLNKLYPWFRWTQYLDSKFYKQFLKGNNEIYHQQCQLFQLEYRQCQKYVQSIAAINPSFQKGLTDYTEDTFEGIFAQAYRQSTLYIYTVIINSLKNRLLRKRKDYLLLTQIAIVHSFDKMVSSNQKLLYFLGENNKFLVVKEVINYQLIQDWLSRAGSKELKSLTLRITKQFF